MCDGALRRAPPAPGVNPTGLRCSPTSNEAKALSVMTWLLLPIIPRCRPWPVKTACYIASVPRQLPMAECTVQDLAFSLR